MNKEAQNYVKNYAISQAWADFNTSRANLKTGIANLDDTKGTSWAAYKKELGKRVH